MDEVGVLLNSYEITRSKSTLSPAFAGMMKHWQNVLFTTPSIGNYPEK